MLLGVYDVKLPESIKILCWGKKERKKMKAPKYFGQIEIEERIISLHSHRKACEVVVRGSLSEILDMEGLQGSCSPWP